MVVIVQKENPVLRKKAKEVLISEIKSPKIKKIIKDMRKALAGEEDGVAIAAPQINIPLRIFVVAGKIFNPDIEHNHTNIKNTLEEMKLYPDLVFINPKIIKFSKKKKYLPEGCLSVRWLYGDVQRSTNVSIEAYNENGDKIERGAGGLLAQIFQHEVDHLDATLFIDKARNLLEILPEKHEKK